MRYCSIDTETTGLDWNHCQILEFGVVIDDLKNPKPLAELPRFHCYVLHPVIIGEPYALSLNWRIIDRIAKRTEGFNYLKPEEIHDKLHGFLMTNGYGPEWNLRVNVAGKNFSAFDKRFIEKVWPKNSNIAFNHRVMDPAMLYFDIEKDTTIPNLKTCMERAGMNKDVEHTAVEDALDVIALIRKYYKIGG